MSASMQKTFDEMAQEFTARVSEAANWKHSYLGAAYATRIQAAIKNLRQAIEMAERHPEIGPT